MISTEGFTISYFSFHVIFFESGDSRDIFKSGYVSLKKKRKV